MNSYISPIGNPKTAVCATFDEWFEIIAPNCNPKMSTLYKNQLRVAWDIQQHKIDELKPYKDKFNKLRKVLIALKEELEEKKTGSGIVSFITNSLKSVGLKKENDYRDRPC